MDRIRTGLINYKGWENSIELSNGIIRLIVTADVGPRIIYYGFSGAENMLCEVDEQLGRTGDSEWNIYGGHRLWHSPEAQPRTYQPDNSPAAWEQTENGIIITQPVENWTHIKKEMKIELKEGSTEVYILHRLTNLGAWDIELSVWALTVMAPGGREIIPQPSHETGLLPNRMLSLWPYTRMNDRRVYWGEKYIMLDQDTAAENPFKIGLPNADGWAAYVNNGKMFVKKYKHHPFARYPDFGASSYETYTNDYMLEMESLSPLATLKPGASAEHSEKWQLFDGIEKPSGESDITKKILPLINNY